MNKKSEMDKKIEKIISDMARVEAKLDAFIESCDLPMKEEDKKKQLFYVIVVSKKGDITKYYAEDADPYWTRNKSIATIFQSKVEAESILDMLTADKSRYRNPSVLLVEDEADKEDPIMYNHTTGEIDCENDYNGFSDYYIEIMEDFTDPDGSSPSYFKGTRSTGWGPHKAEAKHYDSFDEAQSVLKAIVSDNDDYVYVIRSRQFKDD